MTRALVSARNASDSTAVEGLARVGLAARAFVYIVIAWLAAQIAFGHTTEQANQKGALADVASHPGGIVLLCFLGIGFGAYALWRLSEAGFGTAGEGAKAGPRVQSLFRGIVYAVFCVSTFSFIAGHPGQGQAQQQETLTARVMRHGYGQWLVGLTGLVVVGVGLGMIAEGVTRKFEKQLKMQELPGATRKVVVRLGVVGTVARGIVFAIAGGLVLDAAVTFDASKSTGLDGALRTLAGRAYGPWLLGLLALGLLAFGLYGFAAARWAKT
jgi:Domain of Unknown Function (DUF1206)